MFGLSFDGKRVLKVISTKRQPVKGGSPLTLKVDGKNFFVTDVSAGKAGVIQEYEDGRLFAAIRLVARLPSVRILRVRSPTPSWTNAMCSRS